MNYTIVWNENKTEGIILSDESDAQYAAYKSHEKNYSTLADCFRDIYGVEQKCTIQYGLVNLQPTQEMIDAAIDVFQHYDSDDLATLMKCVYKAMIQKLTCNL